MKLDNVADVYPLSPMQQGMLYHAITEPESGVYVDLAVVTFRGSIESDQLVESIQAVAAQHETLKTAFVWDGVDKPLQVVREQVEFPVASEDLRQLDAEQQDERLLELLANHKRKGFELDCAPLLRFTLCAISDHEWRLIICFHHLVLDGWSIHVLLKQIVDHVHDPETLASQERFRYRDYIQWLLGQDHEAAQQFWTKELAGFSAANQIGAGSPGGSNGASGDCCEIQQTLSTELSQRLREFARHHHVTLNTVVQAAWGLIVSRYSGGDNDVVFGSTLAGRPTDLGSVESAVGSFINTLPCRIRIDPQQRLSEWLAEIQSRQAIARQWEFSALAEIQKASDIEPGTPLFDSILVYENYPVAEEQHNKLSVTGIKHLEQSNYPLASLVVPAEQLQWIIIYDSSRYSADFARRILDHIVWLLNAFTSGAAQTPGSLKGLPASQITQLCQWHTASESPQSTTGIMSVLDEMGRKYPQRTAVVSDRKRVTYQELHDQADRIACRLLEHGVGANTAIGLCAERGTRMITGILGILKAGAAYVPLDVIYPQEHFEHVINDAQIDIVLATRENVSHVPSIGNHRVLVLDDLITEAPASRETPHAPQPTTRNDDDLAYLIYTSGSTGKPKGVMISHRNLAHSTLARFQYYDHQPGTYLLLSSFAFDSSVAGIFWTLCSGGTLIIPGSETQQDVGALNELIRREQVTHLLSLPALYRLILESSNRQQLRSLNTAIVAGEAAATDVAAMHMDVAPHAELHNEYGPTEATVWATAHRVLDSDIGAIRFRSGARSQESRLNCWIQMVVSFR